MFAAFSAVIVAIAAGITLFVQTITLSSCRRLECCCGKCELGILEKKKKDDDAQQKEHVPWFDR
jgi:hypothetical protein